MAEILKQDNVKTFIELYNVFDAILRERYDEQNRNLSVITRYINSLEKSSSIYNQKKARKINMLRILRNTLVHEFDFNADHLITIDDDTISFLKDEIEYIKNPINALDISTKIQNLFVAKLDDQIVPILKFMAKEGHTQIPIIENKKLIGVFSPNVIFAYLAKHELNEKTNRTIRDFEEFIPLKYHVSEKYTFIARDANLDEVTDLFDDSHRENKKLVAIFVTEHGLENEGLLGMIVPHDILNSLK